jgi:hypothetical protein
MRWWTLAFAAVLALGGVVAHVSHKGGAPESLFVGGAAAAALATCAAAMSDMTEWGNGPLAVKGAWAVCAALAVKVRVRRAGGAARDRDGKGEGRQKARTVPFLDPAVC